MQCFGDANIIDGYWHMNCFNHVFSKSKFHKNKTNGIYSVENLSGNKRKYEPSHSSFLWHKRLGHISKYRLQELIKQDILPSLDFINFRTCIDCLKCKMTNSRNFSSKRSEMLLGLIHTDLCGPFSVKTICGNEYFMTFIDDYSRYWLIFFISEKSQVLDVFKIYKTEVERQTEKLIKIVRSDRGDEYFENTRKRDNIKGHLLYI